MRPRLIPVAALLALLSAGGCATAREEDQSAADKKSEQFDYVYETGSLVPKKVRRDHQKMDRGQNFEILETNRLEQMQRDQQIRNMPRDPR